MSTSEITLQQDPSIALGQQSTSSAKVPVLGEGFQETTSKPLSRSAQNSDVDEDAGDTTGDGGAKGGKRRLFGFGKKKDKKKEEPVTASSAANSKTPIVQPVAQRAPVSGGSPSRPNHPYRNPSSPSNGNFYSSSPRIVSPAGSQIFERDVQESAVPVPASPAIPSHIQTENHIPAVLDASSEAITNNTLDPDSVEIVMHSSHQPAAMTVSGVGSSDVTGGSWTDELLAHPDKDDAASNYGALDSTDVRRLSFISFADVVQSEHAEHAGSRDSIYLAGLNSLSSNRSPSPVRSPVSSQGFNTSPPTSKSASIKGVDMSPGRKPLSLTNIHNLPSPTGGGELTIETMTQALRRTSSGDLSGARSLPLSPVSPDAMSDGPFR